MFDLEKLSKIRWATTDNNIINFFDTLDNNISDADVAVFKNKTKWSINIEDLREDEIIESDNKKIINNFPDKEWGYLKIPKVLE